MVYRGRLTRGRAWRARRTRLLHRRWRGEGTVVMMVMILHGMFWRDRLVRIHCDWVESRQAHVHSMARKAIVAMLMNRGTDWGRCGRRHDE